MSAREGTATDARPRLSLATKAGLTAATVCSVMVAVQWWMFRPRSVAVAVVVIVPFAGCAFIAWLYAWWVTRFRILALVDSFRRMAAGDLRVELPPAPDADLLSVRDAFAQMAGALHAMTTRLAHADAQRRRLFADLAHELGTPTSSVLGIAEALARPDVAASPSGARLLLHLEHEASRLARLVGDLRDLAQLDDPDTRLERAPADVAALAAAAVERARVAAGGRISVDAAGAEALADIDRGRIDQVLTNLLGNAQRYTPDGGRVAVTVADANGSGEVVITVEDSGAGVPDEMLPRLGERLLRIDPSRARVTGGSGLGLSIVAAVVHRHGGRLAFDRSPLGGLRVTVTLPTRPTT